jgi:hypothetical protein
MYVNADLLLCYRGSSYRDFGTCDVQKNSLFRPPIPDTPIRSPAALAFRAKPLVRDDLSLYDHSHIPYRDFGVSDVEVYVSPYSPDPRFPMRRP